jgi:hypothetical protein
MCVSKGEYEAIGSSGLHFRQKISLTAAGMDKPWGAGALYFLS